MSRDSSLMWQFWIDVGGTFTDCIGISPSGQLIQFKLLSSGICKGRIELRRGCEITDHERTEDPDNFWMGATCRLINAAGTAVQTTSVHSFDGSRGTLTLDDLADATDATRYELEFDVPAPVLAIRWLMKLNPSEQCPPVRIRFGTTRGTNALLTRNGARTALITTKGFADVPLIGNQDRPRLFDLNIRKPEPLFLQVFEVDERISATGAVLKSFCAEDAGKFITSVNLNPAAFDSIAICFLNSYVNPAHEIAMQSALQHAGFEEFSRSSEVTPLIRFVPRCDTTVLDAYLNPVLREYLNEISRQLPGSEIQVMTSTGGLVNRQAFRGRDCILSGPAGGIVGFSKVALNEGFTRSIGFDMGGTSTDVARFDGRFEFENQTQKAGVRIMTPVLAIETVAAGGGSICSFDGVRLSVGPQSAGADPGPACYGSGGPLTVTDLNVFLGRVIPRHFPFQLDVDAVTQRLQQLRTQMSQAGAGPPNVELTVLAEGLIQIANDNMAQAIRRVSIAKGYDPADYVLVSFGGAGSQHACSIARRLGVRQVLVHPLAGILSAYGIGHADVRSIRQASIMQPLEPKTLDIVNEHRRQFERENIDEVLNQGVDRNNIQKAVLSLELRYRGTDSTLMITESADNTFQNAFESEHRRLFGYIRPDREIEVASMRLETVGATDSDHSNNAQPRSVRSRTHSAERSKVFCNGQSYLAPIVHRDELNPGKSLSGPCIVCEPTSTVFIEPDCTSRITASGAIVVTIGERPDAGNQSVQSLGVEPDPVLLEVFNNQFASIAEQMGETLRRTSTSVNVRERLDFSCALFDSDGQLVVNAPHVPVHLGAMGETVRAVMEDHSDMVRGDVFVTNDPYRGGSHLPDVTVITPVYANPADADSARPDFYVANRAHHAEIGGIVPGSMPPFSKTLAEEGVLIPSQKLVSAGTSRDDAIRTLLSTGAYPSRAVEDNLADLGAQAAANECGVRLLNQLSEQYSPNTVRNFMKHIQSSAAKKMRICLSQLQRRKYVFADQLDDGSKICVEIRIEGEEAVIDFSGSAGVHPENLNANRAIATAAVLYSLRCLLNDDVPLNAGVLEPVTIVIPPGILNPPSGNSPETSPAMVGGNVETSQRIVDVMLGALRLAAASQGTMNNLTFGNERFGYYETICGGAGATPAADGADAVHTHMTNTRLTDPEVLEQRYPVRLIEFRIRKGSGGAGQFRGGDGIIREIEFLQPLSVSMLSQRRTTTAPYGMENGKPGKAGENCCRKAADTAWTDLGGSFSINLQPGDRLRIETPGGGGHGS